MKITTNKKAYFEYRIIESFDCGIVLIGNEVKSIRLGNVTIGDSFAYIKDGEIFIKNMYVAKYKQSHVADKHDENRDKKLLLTKREIKKIEKLLGENSTTLILLDVFTLNNKIKVKLAVGKGKKLFDKREDIKKRDVERDIRRNLNT